jgi:hypothetical protein
MQPCQPPCFPLFAKSSHGQAANGNLHIVANTFAERELYAAGLTPK